jgi:DNA-binding transcriptional MocR family regulator
VSLSLTLDRSAESSLYRQIADQIAGQIARGQLPAGGRLPTVRQMAVDLGVTRLTVQTAYAELQAAGWVEATVGRGTFVSGQVQPMAAFSALRQPSSTAGVIDDMVRLTQMGGLHSMASASPDPLLFPANEFWADFDALKSLPQLLNYSPAAGDSVLRAALSDLLNERGLTVGSEDLLVTAGATQGLTLAVQALTRPGDVVLVEQPTYIGFLNIMKLHGLQPVAVPMDEHGVRIDQLERIVAQHRPRLFYTVATFQNPTGATISLERRQALLRLARQHGFTIIEDDLYAPLAFDAPPPPTIKSLDDGDHVLYLTSFSKALAPGLRMGVMAPPAALYERMLALKLGADCGSPLLLQRALAHFLREGHYRRHLRRVIPIYRERRDVALATLATHLPLEAAFTRPGGGLCIWITLPERRGMAEVHRRMREEGWALIPGSVFLIQPSERHFLRLSYGMLPADQLRQGIQLLGRIVREQMQVEATPVGAPSEWVPVV